MAFPVNGHTGITVGGTCHMRDGKREWSIGVTLPTGSSVTIHGAPGESAPAVLGRALAAARVSDPDATSTDDVKSVAAGVIGAIAESKAVAA